MRVENNTIINPRHYGIETAFNSKYPDDPETGKYSENIIIRDNIVIDNQMSPAFHFDYLKNSVVKNNKAMNRDHPDFNIHSRKETEAGFYFSNSLNITCFGNEVNDSRLTPEKHIVLGDNNNNISLSERP